jgi:alanyl-tRNA synthetase
VERIEFSAGPAAIEAAQRERALLEKTAEELGVPIEQAPHAAQKFVREWKDLRSKVSSLEKELASFKSSNLEFENLGDINFYMDNMIDADSGEIQKLVRKITSTEGNLAAIGFSKDSKGSIILASSKTLNINCGSILREALSSVGGNGGGNKLYAQGACNPQKISSVLLKIKELII